MEDWGSSVIRDSACCRIGSILCWLTRSERVNGSRRRSADRQPPDQKRWLAHAHRYALSLFAAHADAGVEGNARAIKAAPDFVATREEVLNMIWSMEEDIMAGGHG